MPRILNLAGFEIGDNLNLSVSQGALTAGPVNVTSWGTGSGGDGGTITINTMRTQYEVAPDSVRFTVDLDSSSFDTAGPTGGEIYDARLHDLIFLWDFDDAATGDWTAPENVLPHWKNRNVAKGPFVAHMYTSPGTYNPSVLVIEPSSGKMATHSVEVVVSDPNVVYGAAGGGAGEGTYADTAVVNPVGVTDWSGEPTGALRVNVDTLSDLDTWWTNLRSDNRPKRVLLRRGETYSCKLNFTNTNSDGIYFGAYGSGNKPIVNGVPGSEGSESFLLNASASFAINSNGANDPAPEIRLTDWDVRGNLDPTSDQQYPYPADSTLGVYCARQSHFIFSNVDFDGIVRHGMDAALANATHPSHWHMDNCTMTNFGGQYPVFFNFSGVSNSSGVWTGCRFSQAPSAHDSSSGNGSRAPVRMDWCPNSHIRGCDFYHTDSTQPHVKLYDTAQAEGGIANFHSCAFEGGSSAVRVNGNTGGSLSRSTVHNMVFDGLIWVGNHSSKHFIDIRATGATIRNCLAIMPSVTRHPSAPDNFTSFVEIREYGSYDADIVGAAPIRVFNNTFVSERSFAQNNSATPTETGGTYAYTAVVVDNNIFYEDSTITTYDPLATNALFTPRCPGRRDGATFILETGASNEYVTPSDAVKSYRPTTGSTAIGGYTSGLKAYMHIESVLGFSGTSLTDPDAERPATPSIGAWEQP